MDEEAKEISWIRINRDLKLHLRIGGFWKPFDETFAKDYENPGTILSPGIQAMRRLLGEGWKLVEAPQNFDPEVEKRMELLQANLEGSKV